MSWLWSSLVLFWNQRVRKAHVWRKAFKIVVVATHCSNFLFVYLSDTLFSLQFRGSLGVCWRTSESRNRVYLLLQEQRRLWYVLRLLNFPLRCDSNCVVTAVVDVLFIQLNWCVRSVSWALRLWNRAMPSSLLDPMSSSWPTLLTGTLRMRSNSGQPIPFSSHCMFEYHIPAYIHPPVCVKL